MSAPLPRVESRRPVIATSVAPRRLTCGMSATTSAVSPECDSARTTSPSRIIPRSPWIASDGCRKNEAVPVEASVAAIFWPTIPLLPMPVTTTRQEVAPVAFIASTARSKPSSRPGGEAAHGFRFGFDHAAGFPPGGRGHRTDLSVCRRGGPPASRSRDRGARARRKASRKSFEAGEPASAGGRSRRDPPREAIGGDEAVGAGGDRARRHVRECQLPRARERPSLLRKGFRATATRPGAISRPSTSVRGRTEVDRARGGRLFTF